MRTLTFVLLIVASTFLSAENQTVPSPKLPLGTSGSYTTAESQVLEVFTAKQGTSRSVAYLVEWKNQKVIVSDPLAKTHLKKGDTIRFMIHNTKIEKQGKDPVDILSFIIL